MKRLLKLKKTTKNMKNGLFKEYFTNYQSPSDMYKKLRDTGGKNEDQVYLIKEVLNKMKKKKKCA